MNARLSLAFALLAAGCAAHADTDDQAAAERQIRAALANWVAAANRGDYAAAATVWAPDLIGWAPSGPDDSYEREHAAATLPPQPVRTTYALAIDEVLVDGALAVVRDTWTQTSKAQDGRADTVATFRSFEVWRRWSNGQWLISRWIDGPVRASSAAR